MKKWYAALCLLVFGVISSFIPAQTQLSEFEKYFVDQTLRVDLYHQGDANSESYSLDACYVQGPWAGTRTLLLDPFEYGRYQAKVYDKATQTLIFKKGFDAYFGEYKTTTPARQGVKRTYHESVLLPLPKGTILFTIESRDRQNRLSKVFEQEIDPNSPFILKRRPLQSVKTFPLLENGPSQQKVDLAIVAEGYTSIEEDKLKKDLDRAMNILFSQEPYSSRKKDFNLYGVWKPSEESGCDEPANHIYKNTSIHASFDSLGLSRYVLIEDNRSLRDVAGHVPYDALVVMVNHSRYGGGGIYSLYCVFTADNALCDYLFLHEFGHSFSGLGDEYYTSEVAYNEFYPAGIEPLEPNLTALLDPNNLKWKQFMSSSLPLPTPWNKEKYENFGPSFQKAQNEISQKIADAKKRGKSEKYIARLTQQREELIAKRRQAYSDFFATHPMKDKVGAFEGAGYAAKGLYRPMLNCIMFSNNTKAYCIVCSDGVERMIEFYTK